MKLLNILCSNQTLILEDFMTHFRFFNIHIIQKAQPFMINMPLKQHHIGICNKNCKNIDVLTRILACLVLACSNIRHYKIFGVVLVNSIHSIQSHHSQQMKQEKINKTIHFELALDGVEIITKIPMSVKTMTNGHTSFQQ